MTDKIKAILYDLFFKYKVPAEIIYELEKELHKNAGNEKSLNKYLSAVFCEHANENPSGVCICPMNCACREHMCK